MGAESAQQQKRPRHANPTWPCPWTARKRRAGLDGANRGMESLTLYRNGEYLASSAKRLIQMGCSNIRTAVAAAFQEAGHVVRLMQQLKLQLPFYDPLDPRS